VFAGSLFARLSAIVSPAWYAASAPGPSPCSTYLNHLIVVLGGHPVPLIGYLVGGLGCLLMARRDLRVSTTTMLATETISVLIVTWPPETGPE
jgi:hypothetical protein